MKQLKGMKNLDRPKNHSQTTLLEQLALKRGG